MPKQNKKPMHRVPFYRRPVIIVSCLVAIIVIAAVVILAVKAISGGDDQTEEVVEETENVLVYGEDDDEENDLSPEDQKVIVQYEGENPNNLDYLTGLITYTEVRSGTLVAMVSIDQYLSDGICVASLKNDDRVVTSVEQAVEADASTSHCAIEINLAGVRSGKYQLEVVVSSGGKTGTLTSNIEL